MFLAVFKTRDGIKLGVHGERSQRIMSNQPGRTYSDRAKELVHAIAAI